MQGVKVGTRGAYRAAHKGEVSSCVTLRSSRSFAHNRGAALLKFPAIPRVGVLLEVMDVRYGVDHRSNATSRSSHALPSQRGRHRRGIIGDLRHVRTSRSRYVPRTRPTVRVRTTVRLGGGVAAAQRCDTAHRRYLWRNSHKGALGRGLMLIAWGAYGRA